MKFIIYTRNKCALRYLRPHLSSSEPSLYSLSCNGRRNRFHFVCGSIEAANWIAAAANEKKLYFTFFFGFVQIPHAQRSNGSPYLYTVEAEKYSNLRRDENANPWLSPSDPSALAFLVFIVLRKGNPSDRTAEPYFRRLRFPLLFLRRISVETRNELPEDTCNFVQIQFYRTRWPSPSRIRKLLTHCNDFTSLTTQFHLNSFRRHRARDLRTKLLLLVGDDKRTNPFLARTALKLKPEHLNFSSTHYRRSILLPANPIFGDSLPRANVTLNYTRKRRRHKLDRHRNSLPASEEQ